MSFSLRRIAAVAAFLSVFSIAASADSISGTVTNKTNNKPAGGDEVVLIRLAQGMQESTRTTTDSKGRFTLDVPDQGMHLIRVTHQKANYFRPAPPGTQSVEVEVYDVAEKVSGVTSEADVMRIQTDESGKVLKIVQNFWVKNESTPPRTQYGDRPFEFYLPAGAVIEGSAALAPGGMPVQASPMPLGDASHYAFVFPIRPGETRFQISYHLPYDGTLKLAPKPSTNTDTVAIMLPKSMTFKADASSPYSPVTEEMAAQTFVARNVSSSSPLSFTLSGTGQLPRDSQTGGQAGQGDEAAQPAAGGSAATDTRPGGGLGNPIDPEGTNDPWAKYKWWILGGLGLAMAAGAGFLLKSGGQPAPATVTAPVESTSATGDAGVLASLRDELFALETERIEGRLNEADYTEQKAAIETVLKRALQRKAQNASS